MLGYADVVPTSRRCWSRLYHHCNNNDADHHGNAHARPRNYNPVPRVAEEVGQATLNLIHVLLQGQLAFNLQLTVLSRLPM